MRWRRRTVLKVTCDVDLTTAYVVMTTPLCSIFDTSYLLAGKQNHKHKMFWNNDTFNRITSVCLYVMEPWVVVGDDITDKHTQRFGCCKSTS